MLQDNISQDLKIKLCKIIASYTLKITEIMAFIAFKIVIIFWPFGIAHFMFQYKYKLEFHLNINKHKEDYYKRNAESIILPLRRNITKRCIEYR